MVGRTRKGDAVARAHLAAGQGNVADGGVDLGNVLESLVKVAKAEEHDSNLPRNWLCSGLTT